MATVAEALQTALQHHKAGQLADAERIYRQVLQVEPRQPDALHLLGLIAHQVGKHEPAIQHIEQAVALVPTQPTFLLSLANVCQAMGQLDRAETACREVVRLQPNLAEAHLALGNIRRLQGQLADAEACYREAVRLQPTYLEAHNNLGNLFRRRGRHRDAEACYMEALRLQPENPIALANLGVVFREQGRLDEAESCLRHALRVHPAFAQAQCYLGDVLLDRNNVRDAEFCYREALRLQPNMAEAHRGMGVSVHRQRRAREAEASYREAIRLRPDYVEAFGNLGDLMRDVQNIPEARQAYADAIRYKPDSVEALNNLGACLIEEGKSEEAIVHLHEALRLRRGYVPSLGNLGTLARDGFYQFTDDEMSQLRTQLETGNLSVEGRSTLCYSLANLLDKRKDYDEAFKRYVEANELKRQVFEQRGLGFNPKEHTLFTDSLLATFTPEYFRRVKSFGLPTELPVFIVGMPRSGTTLVEQILASHPQVYGAGELSDIPNLGREMGQMLQPPEDYMSCLQRVGADLARAAAGRHLERLANLGGPAVRVTDKLPANIFHLGLIAMLFPQARVIHCTREKIDICLSCFLQDFTTLSFATRMDDIAVYYNEYERLAAHWRACLPLKVVEIPYEELIASQEAVSRRMVEFIGLEWDDRCLAFHKNKRVIQTSSVAQVRQPIYNSSVGRWKRYRKHLGPLLKDLGCADA